MQWYLWLQSHWIELWRFDWLLAGHLYHAHWRWWYLNLHSVVTWQGIRVQREWKLPCPDSEGTNKYPRHLFHCQLCHNSRLRKQVDQASNKLSRPCWRRYLHWRFMCYSTWLHPSRSFRRSNWWRLEHGWWWLERWSYRWYHPWRSSCTSSDRCWRHVCHEEEQRDD